MFIYEIVVKSNDLTYAKSLLSESENYICTASIAILVNNILYHLKLKLSLIQGINFIL